MLLRGGFPGGDDGPFEETSTGSTETRLAFSYCSFLGQGKRAVLVA